VVFFVPTPTFAELESGQQDASDKAGERVIGAGGVVAYRGQDGVEVIAGGSGVADNVVHKLDGFPQRV
jgi:hypothetical protein